MTLFLLGEKKPLGSPVFGEGQRHFEPEGKRDFHGRALRACSCLQDVQQKHSQGPQKGHLEAPSGCFRTGHHMCIQALSFPAQDFRVKISSVWSGGESEPVFFFYIVRVRACALEHCVDCHLIPMIWLYHFSWASTWEASPSFCASHFLTALTPSAGIMVTGTLLMTL